MLQRSLAHSFVVVALLAAALFIVLTTSVRAADANVVCVQRELNALGHGAGTPDGQIGPKTIAAVNECRYPEALLKAMNGLQFEHYHRIVLSDPSQMRFIRGWLTRVWERRAAE